MIYRNLLASVLIPVLAALVGCNANDAGDGTDQEPAAATTTPSSGQLTAKPEDETEASGLAALSPEDRALAEKQEVCLVSGEPLGSMGTPIKTEVKGRTVFLCCEGCEEMVKEDPDQYLAKLDALSDQP